MLIIVTFVFGVKRPRACKDEHGTMPVSIYYYLLHTAYKMAQGPSQTPQIIIIDLLSESMYNFTYGYYIANSAASFGLGASIHQSLHEITRLIIKWCLVVIQLVVNNLAVTNNMQHLYNSLYYL